MQLVSINERGVFDPRSFRIVGRLDVSFGFARHTIRGMKKMHVRVGLALVVMLAVALGRVRQKHIQDMRRLVG